MSFGKGVSAVKDIVFEWPKGTVSQISEIFLTRGVDASLDGDIEALRDLVAKAKTVDTAAGLDDRFRDGARQGGRGSRGGPQGSWKA